MWSVFSWNESIQGVSRDFLEICSSKIFGAAYSLESHNLLPSKEIRHIPSIEKEEQPGKDREGWEKELSRYWHEQSEHQKSCCACFHQRPRSLTDRERENSEYDQYQIMPVIVRPSVMSESLYRICWVERGLDLGNIRRRGDGRPEFGT